MRQAVLHLDGDAFFASVEQSLDPALRERPVMTGAERGIVAAFSYEAKARGIVRGMQTWRAREVCPELAVRASDYRTYRTFSTRATAIVRRSVPLVEEYGIDECFALVPDATLEEGARVARQVQETLRRELGVGYSVGVAATKTLAKAGSKWNKPYGITVVSEDAREDILRMLQVGQLWGIGRRMAPRLMALGIHTALDLARQDETWAATHLDRPYLCMWAELRGIPALAFGAPGREARGSVQVSRTFWPASQERAVVWGELCRNVERACEKLRRESLRAGSLAISLKTQQFSYRRADCLLPVPTAYPEQVLAAAAPLFARMLDADTTYRATGVTLGRISGREARQKSLFSAASEPDDPRDSLYAAVDALNLRKRKVWLASAAWKPDETPPVFRLPLLRGGAR